ncbi:MAG: hypothetical protein GYA15_12520 [Leptolinea sp.]|jgi:hypothetical protein|nr:hypothetical protein [Leptolinea sp.]
MRINPNIYGILVVAVFFGTILGFQAAGFWSISGKVTADGQAIQPLANDVNSIKGWMTLEQISSVFNVSVSEILQQFSLPADTPGSTAIKDLESETFDTTGLKTWLEEKGNVEPVITSEVLPAISSGTEPSTLPVITTAAAVESADQAAPESTITGKTTYQDLLDWGISQEAIERIIGGVLPERSTIIKDHLSGLGLEFGTIKAQLQAELDKTK